MEQPKPVEGSGYEHETNKASESHFMDLTQTHLKAIHFVVFRASSVSLITNSSCVSGEERLSDDLIQAQAVYLWTNEKS